VLERHAELDEFLEQLRGLLLIVDALGHDESSVVDNAFEARGYRSAVRTSRLTYCNRSARHRCGQVYTRVLVEGNRSGGDKWSFPTARSFNRLP
jgi:hypothetical protein